VNPAVLVFDPNGMGHCLYSEAIDLQALGVLQIQRASRIEFNNQAQCWEVLSLNGQVLLLQRFPLRLPGLGTSTI
jgi:hypothetical protein